MEKGKLYKFIVLLYDKVVGQKRATGHNIDFWREKIYAAIAITVLLLGFIALVVSVLACIPDRLVFVAVFDILLYITAVIILLNKNASIGFKKSFLCFIFYLVGIVLLVALGKIGAGYSWLFTFPIITGILLGLNAGVIALIINMITFVIVGVFFIYLKSFPALPVVEYDLVAWITVAINFTFLDIMITIVNGIILRGLKESLSEQDILAENLKKNRQKIINANIKLRNEVKQRIKIESDLREAITQAESANIAKTEFLSNISHEIRTPLNAIIGFSEILFDLDESGKCTEFLNSIHSASFDLLSLVNKILDMAKIESEKLVIKEEIVDIEKLFNDIKIIFEHQIEEKGLKSDFILQSDGVDFLILDEIRLKQVLINVIDNAIKFTEQGYIRVEFLINKVDHGENADLRILVSDSGIGIDKVDHEKIFNTFWQKDGKTTRRYEGTGLGLALAKKLLDLMDGEIILDSKIDEGSKFTFRFKNLQIPDELMLKEKNISKFSTRVKNEFESNILSENELLNEEFLDLLNNKYIPQIEKLEEQMVLDDILEFARQLKNFAQEFNCTLLEKYSKELITFSATFDLEKVKRVLYKISNFSLER